MSQYLTDRLLAAARNRMLSTQIRGDRELRCLSAEQLEPRILYSAAPVEAAAPVAEVEAPVQEAPESGAVAPTPVSEIPVETPLPAVAPVDSDGEGEISANREVALVDVNEEASMLNQDVVETLAAEARQRWIDSGISAEQIAALDSVQYNIADIGGAHLGVAEGFSITIDDDAGGTGVGSWFIDATPELDEEFGGSVSNAASVRFDLLSTLIHEQGHVLGLADVSGNTVDVMGGILDAGTRRLPTSGQASGAVAGSLDGAHFLTANLSRESLTINGEQSSGGGSFSPSLSDNGAFLLFESDASNLVNGDTNGQRDIFIKYLLGNSGYIERVNTNAANEQSSGGDAARAHVSANGFNVVFDSTASDLVVGDSNGFGDVFFKNRQTGEIIRVNTNAAGDESTDAFATAADISADGRYVLFGSAADDLVADDTNGEADLFLKDLETGTISRVNTNAAGEQAVGHGAPMMMGSFSADGRYVVFGSGATNLVAGDTNGNFDLFRKDLTTGEIIRISTNSAGQQTATRPGGSSTGHASISTNGRYVVFQSEADDLVPEDDNGLVDIFVKDLMTGAISRVNTDALGGQATGGETENASISGDGRFVVFESKADNLVADDTNGTVDTFVKDLRTGRVERLTVNAAGEQSVGAVDFSGSTFISGTSALFSSDATNLLGDDTNGDADVFLSDFSPLIESFSTSVSVDDAGDLYITGSGSVADDLSIEVSNGRLEVRNAVATVGGPIVGGIALGNDGQGVSIDLAAFTGDIIVRTQGGDDRIAVGDLAGIDGGLSVDGGSGVDLVTQTGAISLLGAAGISLVGEQIRLENGASISVQDGGVDLLADQGDAKLVKAVGLMIEGSTITTTGDGDINLRGKGGTAGSGNLGVKVAQTQIEAGGGKVTIVGTGGDGKNGNLGVEIGRGTEIRAMGSQDFDIFGTGGGSGDRNGGIFIDSDVYLQSAEGRLFVIGTGADARSSNVGLEIREATLVNAGDSFLNLRGTGGGSGSNNVGTKLIGTTVRGEGAAEVNVLGFGSATATGASNRGVDLKSATITSTGTGLVRITGTGGTGTSNNEAMRAVNSAITSEASSVLVLGNASALVSKNNNRAVNLSGTSISAGTTATVTGRAGGGVNGNEALRVISSSVTAVGEVEVEGFGSTLTTGSLNRGAFVRNIELSGSSVGLLGDAGAGTNRNEGLRLLGGSFQSTSANVGIAGRGTDFTTGRGNFGAYVRGITIDAHTNAGISGNAGSGTNGNYALFVERSTLVSQSLSVQFVGSGNELTSGSGNYGALLKNVDATAATEILMIGNSGVGTHRNAGLTVRGGNYSAAATTGTSITVFGNAKAASTGNANYGIFLNGTTFSAANDVGINSVAGGGNNGNYATQLRNATVTSEMGDIVIRGQVHPATVTTGKGNYGVRITGTDLKATNIQVDGSGGLGTSGNYGTTVIGGTMTSSNGYVVVIGSANAGATGSGNSGTTVKNAVLTAVGDGLSVNGTGGGGIGNNYGARIGRGSFSSDSGSVGLSGGALASTLGSGNYGLRVNGAMLSAASNINIDGGGGGGTSKNYGLNLSRVTGTAGNQINVDGTAESTTTGKNNRGADIAKSRLTAGASVMLTGSGGGGNSGNVGLRMVGGTFDATTGGLVIDGMADALTTDRGNSGVHIVSKTTLVGTSIVINGTGGGGTGANYGVFMDGGIDAAGAVVNGVATDGVSDDEAGGFPF